jgi:hypothetical protein
METISSANSGFPPAASTMIARTGAGRPSVPTRWRTSMSVSASLKGSRWIAVVLYFPPPHVGRISKSSGRARQTSMMGTLRDQSAMCSISSCRVALAQWTSSMTATIG